MRVETLALIGRFVSALDSSDVGSALAMLHEDVAFDTLAGERQIGRDAFRWYLAGRPRGERFHDLVTMANDDGTRAAAEFTLKGQWDDGSRYSVNAGIFFAVSGEIIERLSLCGFPAAPDSPAAAAAVPE